MNGLRTSRPRLEKGWIRFLALGVGLGVIGLVLLITIANSTASDIVAETQANDLLTDSAPQQAVAASWAIRDTVIASLRADGVRNGILALMLGVGIGAAGGYFTGRRPETLIDGRACPHCLQDMRREARVCFHCGRESEPWSLDEGAWRTKDDQGRDVWWTDRGWTYVRPGEETDSGKA